MNELNKLLEIKNCESVSLDKVPILNIDDFRNTIIEEVQKDNNYISSFFAMPDNEMFRLFAVIANPSKHILNIISSYVSDSYESLTPLCPQVHLFEREIFEEFGIYPNGHPWLKPVRKKNLVDDSDYNFFKVDGEEIHEVAVGPVHAGIIEPGHFRFQCLGEKVFHLEISLGYQHRGIEKSLIGSPNKKTSNIMETIAGDTSIGHSLAYSQLCESLSKTKISKRAEYIRGIALELERIANHTGDLGALAGDIGFLPTSSYCGRIRGDFLNMTALLCGNRFGRNLIINAGVNYDITQNEINDLKNKISHSHNELKQSVSLLWETNSVMNRFIDTGKLNNSDCVNLGILGLPARSCGFEKDVRLNFPTGIFNDYQIPISIHDSGDIYSRAYVRWLEIENSVKFIQELLENIPSGEISQTMGALNSESISVSLVEAWRGEICHVGITDNNGKFKHYKIVDPSFHNWSGLAIAMRDEQISDFPLCNKSFNLSYCGFDL